MNEMMPYILEQPDLCQRMLANCAALAAPFVQAVATYQPDRLLLVASGTSRNAACAAAPFMEWVLGLPVTVVAPSCLEAVAGKKPLLVFISQGGNSTNTIAAIENHRDTPSLALTGNPDGEINQLCNSTVTIPCGPEKAGPKTKGYTSTVLLLYLMALEAARTRARCPSPTMARLWRHCRLLLLLCRRISAGFKRGRMQTLTRSNPCRPSMLSAKSRMHLSAQRVR